MEETNGYFYIVQLLPEDAPNIIKLGYTRSIKSRMIAYHTICSAAHVIKSWQCPARWERAATAYMAGEGCQAIGRETYRARSIEEVAARGEAFFNLSTQQKEATARKYKEAIDARRTVADMARDAEQWARGEYTPRNRADLARMKRHAAIRKN